MNRTLKRPMFRMGGSAAEGITSGLDKPKRGLVNEPGKYSQPPMDMSNILATTRQQMTPENIAAYQPYMQRPQGEGLNRFLINFGLDLASRSPTGKGFSGLLATAAGAAKKPTEQLFADMDRQRLTKQAAEADLFKTLLQGNIDIAAEAAGEGGAAKTYSQLEIGKEIKREVGNIAQYKTDLKGLEPGSPEYEAKMLELNQSQQNLDFLRKNNPETEALLKNDTLVEGLVNSIMQELARDTEKYPKGMSDKNLYLDAIKEFKIILQSEATGVPVKKADGGRIEYNVGGGAGMNMAPETTDQESMPTRKMPIDYDTLRARLPKEITDDVVKLISSSPEALEDFATIATQQDVDQFNQKYSVNLVLPQEA